MDLKLANSIISLFLKIEPKTRWYGVCAVAAAVEVADNHGCDGCEFQT
jgi:hypothetical protein